MIGHVGPFLFLWFTCMHDFRFFSRRDVTHFTLYFSGHGTKPQSGDWSFGDDSFIKLKQILNHWSPNDQPHKKLLIISNSCFSGSWVKALNRYHQRKEFLGVEMVAACPSDTLMDENEGSNFTKAICDKNYHFNRVPKYTRSLPMSRQKIWLPKFTKNRQKRRRNWSNCWINI